MALASAYEDAGRQMQQAALQAAGTEREMLGTATGYVAPWQRAGGAAVGQIGGLLGLPGYSALDPTKTLEGTPGYKFLQDQMTKRLGAYGAATGSAFSGPAMKGAMQYGGGLAQNYAWQPYMSALQNLSGSGLQAGGLQGGWTMGAAQNIGQDYMTAAQANAMAQIQAANARSQEGSGMLGDLLGAGGFGLGMLFGGPAGGGLGGMIGKGIGSIFNPTPSMGAGGGWGGDVGAVGASGFMADGGPVASGRPYVVGERGPEVIVPQRDGVVIPNHLTEFSHTANFDDPMAAFANLFRS